MRFRVQTLLILLAIEPTAVGWGDDAYLIADLGRHHVLRGEWEQGLSLLKQADAIAAKGAAVPDFTVNQATIVEEYLKFGTGELRKMLADRPQMAQGVDEEDLLFQWAARQFGGESTPNRMLWSNGVPRKFKAQHYPPTKEARGYIQIVSLPASGPEHHWREFEQLWSYAVFELNNAASAEAFAAAYTDAAKGTISRDAFIKRCFRTEYLATVKTRRFYLQVFADKVRRLHQHSDPDHWFFQDGWLGSWQRALGHYDRQSRYPWRVYGEYYDMLAPKK